MSRIIFVTTNNGKVASAQKYFDDSNVEFASYYQDLIEPRSESLEEIAKAKVLQAYDKVKEPCISLDAGFYIKALNGWPGTFVNINLRQLKLKKFLKLMEDEIDRECYFKECVAYYDGNEVYYFYGLSEGTLANSIRGGAKENEWSNLWSIFIPQNHSHTLAEMTNEERNNRNDNHTSSLKEFATWYKEKDKIKVKK